MNHNNFHFTQISGKTNDAIFLKSQKKPCFWAILAHFCAIGICSKKSSSHTELCLDPYHYAKFQKRLMSQSRENVETRKDGWTDPILSDPSGRGRASNNLSSASEWWENT